MIIIKTIAGLIYQTVCKLYRASFVMSLWLYWLIKKLQQQQKTNPQAHPVSSTRCLCKT